MLPLITTATALLLTLAPQDISKSGSPPTDAPAKPMGATAQALKSRIHTMRTNLLLGGDRVRQAESEASKFYGQKIETIEQGLDSLRADISEKQATYKLALDRSIQASGSSARVAAMREASSLRGQLKSLREEENTLKNQRKRLSNLIAAVKGRDRHRKLLAAKLEASAAPDETAGIPLPAVGLAPRVDAPSSSLVIDQGLVADLLSRDPRKGRRVLFEADPAGYWTRFPLQPPVKTLTKAFALPPPDPPEHR